VKLTGPGSGGIVTISADGVPPSLPFTTDAPGRHRWDWRLTWRDQTSHGSVTTPQGRWEARAAIGPGGGVLDVTATAGAASANASVRTGGTNPSAMQITAHLAHHPGAAGFDRIVVQESRGHQFAVDGQPVVSFDGGVGLCQLTHPPATPAQAWDWRANLDAGVALFAAKHALAERHLGQAGRRFTPDQATREAVCLWNGGFYHVWDGAAWVRPATIVCDKHAGNIGWDMTDPANRGQPPATLHARDVASYSRGHGAHWRYFGVCYADHILGGWPLRPDDGRLYLWSRSDV